MKNRIILISELIIMSVGLFAQSSKEKIYDDGNIRVNVFTHNIKTDKSYIQFWDEWEFISEESRRNEISGQIKLCNEYHQYNELKLFQQFYSIKTCYEIDCSTGMFRTLQTIYYTFDGKLIKSFENRTDESLEWRIPPPETIMETIYNYITKKVKS